MYTHGVTLAAWRLQFSRYFLSKVGVPSVSGGYGAANTFSDDRIDAIRQRTCQGCAFPRSAFFRRCSVFKLLTPKVHRRYRKITKFMQKSDTLTEKLKNFAAKAFMRTPIHVFLPSFAEICKAEVTKRVRGIHHEKRWVGASGAISPKILKDHSFPFLCHVLSKSVQFSRRYVRKCLPGSLQYRREARRQ